ncbi:MAG: hypothetical protein IJD57_04350 [Candidatus Gastranaerophilales bacterium]|nr:hypothetical protein [Candidatus Gastranaerophilales bacterium]
MKNCPFKNCDCNSDCALFIKAEELNELVVNRLKSIGVMSVEDGGMCSLKNMALAQSRYIFENTKVFK